MKLTRYAFKNGVSERILYIPLKQVIEYDSVVDRSQFSLDRENVRRNIIDASQAPNNLAYDKTPPSEIEVALRSGKLDKADVHQLRLNLIEEGKQNAKKKQQEKKIQELKELDSSLKEHADNMQSKGESSQA